MSRIQRLIQPQRASASCLHGALTTLLLVSAMGATALFAMGEPPAKSAAKKDTAARTAAPIRTTASLDAAGGPADVDFARIMVKHQPKAPQYPAAAKEAKIQGTVEVSITIDPEGRVTEARAVSGPAELRECAENYAREWVFRPCKVKGKAVAARFKLSMPFRLR